MRHAKSSWDNVTTTDRSRPLNRRGRRDAPLVGEQIALLGWEPEVVLHSDAVRCQETWERMRAAFDVTLPVRQLSTFYLAGLAAVRQAVCDLDDGVRKVLLIGHNPGWEEVVYRLTGDDHRLTTGNAAMLRIAAERWSEALAAEGRWALEHLIRPREL